MILNQRARAGGRTGFSYVAIILPVAVLGITLAAYLKLVSGQNYAATRSQSWNIALVIAESGVEEALAHLNSGSTNLTANGWSRNGSIYSKRTYLRTNEYYDVSINCSNVLYPVITATGTVPPVINR